MKYLLIVLFMLFACQRSKDVSVSADDTHLSVTYTGTLAEHDSVIVYAIIEGDTTFRYFSQIDTSTIIDFGDLPVLDGDSLSIEFLFLLDGDTIQNGGYNFTLEEGGAKLLSSQSTSSSDDLSSSNVSSSDAEPSSESKSSSTDLSSSNVSSSEAKPSSESKSSSIDLSSSNVSSSSSVGNDFVLTNNFVLQFLNKELYVSGLPEFASQLPDTSSLSNYQDSLIRQYYYSDLIDSIVYRQSDSVYLVSHYVYNQNEVVQYYTGSRSDSCLYEFSDSLLVSQSYGDYVFIFEYSENKHITKRITKYNGVVVRKDSIVWKDDLFDVLVYHSNILFDEYTMNLESKKSISIESNRGYNSTITFNTTGDVSFVKSTDGEYSYGYSADLLSVDYVGFKGEKSYIFLLGENASLVPFPILRKKGRE